MKFSYVAFDPDGKKKDKIEISFGITDIFLVILG